MLAHGTGRFARGYFRRLRFTPLLFMPPVFERHAFTLF